MANQQLIQMAREVGASQGFNNAGEAFEASLSKWVDQAQSHIDERKKTKEAADARVADYMDKLPNGNLAKIPEYAKETVASFLRDGRNSYAEHAHALRDLDPQDKEYQEHVSEMNRISQSFVTLDAQFSRLMENKMDYMEDLGHTSYGNKPENIDFLSDAYTDTTDMIFTPEGNILFSKDGKELSLDELPKVVKTDYDASIKMLTLNRSYQEAGIEITGALEKNLRGEITAFVKSGGRDRIISLAADDIFEEGGKGLGVPDDLLHNPERFAELTEFVITNWIDIIKNSAAEGKRIQEEATTAKTNETIRARNATKTPKVPAYSLDKFAIEDN